MNSNILILGLMSGSSLDGLDIAACTFQVDQADQQFRIIDWRIESARTAAYSNRWRRELKQADTLAARELIDLDHRYGTHLGNMVTDFCMEHNLYPDLIASHGHTVFHHPSKGYSYQIGNGTDLAAVSSTAVAYDFRSLDIAMGGQGAPLAPIAERWLFSDTDYFLNLGGIANISAHTNSGIIAFDVGGANQVLDSLAALVNKAYDEQGHLAAQGTVISDLLDRLNANPYFALPYPKSLSNQWVKKEQTDIVISYPATIEDRMCTFQHHLAQQVAAAIGMTPKARLQSGRLMVSGGGAFNQNLLRLIQAELDRAGINLQVFLPAAEIINFKEALLMALMGLLRIHGVPNCIATVTGSRGDVCGGQLVRI